ncbi:hypothetical protein NLI96_g10395 [Meripilus lineatus]|uniref:Uncharacterized protein n=1 Tax=Meripilus lineatus TaxID=2056292 RepID=A0AAD5UYC9_9APHY|nr:hypothetical protein NLI96_g10395 [Physisporinus lineatus]
MSAQAVAPDGHAPPPTASVTSLSIPVSVHSVRAPSAGTRTVVTSPPWARDEPPSPYDHDAPASRSKDRISEQPRPSDVASFISSSVNSQDAGPSRWWAFTRHRPHDSASVPFTTSESKQSGSRTITIPSWLTAYSVHRRSQDEDISTIRGKDTEAAQPTDASPALPQSRFHLDLPHSDLTMTIAQNMTPGWDSPWSPRPPADLVARITTNGTAPSDLMMHGEIREEDSEKLSLWARRKKKIRVYMLTNTYVPLDSSCYLRSTDSTSCHAGSLPGIFRPAAWIVADVHETGAYTFRDGLYLSLVSRLGSRF